VLSGAYLWSVLANFFVQIDPWSLSAKTPPEVGQSMSNFLSRLDVFDVTLLAEFDLLCDSTLANPLQREPGFLTGIY
jgi:hypothetical protein